jgi:chemotaxis family two-component system sensor kinase Cph1
LSAHYEPAAGGRVGGDWYDAFLLPDGRLAIALGDVAGHGVGTAGIMAQLRNALRAHLLEEADPASALTRLNSFASWLLPDAFATAIVACLDVNTGAATVACAGHPAPYVRRAGGSVTALAVSVSPPLGLTVPRAPSSEFVLGLGDSVVLYSDGLVERRGEDIDVGLIRLRDWLGTPASIPDARTIYAEVANPDGFDDATTLVVHRSPDNGHGDERSGPAPIMTVGG